MHFRLLPKRWPALCRAVYRDRTLLVMTLPAIAYFLVFKYLPMLGLVAAFQNFSYRKGFWGSPFVGLRWFDEFFRSFYFGRLLGNTLLLNLYSILFGFPVPILFALMLNELRGKRAQRLVQTVTYFPHFISTVIVVGLMMDLLAPRTGMINRLIVWLGGNSVMFMTSPRWFRTIYILSDIWQNYGYNAIIYIAAISSIEQEMFDAAQVDGAGRLQQIRHITMPAILPTVIIMLIMRLGRMMNVGYEKILLMYTPATYETADVIQTYVYRKGIVSADVSYSTAIGLFNSMANFLLVYGFNAVSRRLGEVSLW